MSTGVEIPVQLVWALANTEATIAGDVRIRPQHFFLAILKLADKCLADQLDALDLSQAERVRLLHNARDIRHFLEMKPPEITKLRRSLRQRTRTGRGKREATMLHRSPEARRVFTVATQNALRARRQGLSVLHILEALFATGSVTLDGIGVTLRDQDNGG